MSNYRKNPDKLRDELGIVPGGATNLSYNAATRVVSSDTGTDATLTLADVTNAGLLTSADFTKLSNTSGTNTGDNAVNSNYSGLVSNATHTGDATGATALTVVKIQGKDFPTLAAGDDQKYPKYNHGTNAFVMSSVTATQPDIPLTKIAPTANQTITAGYSGYISCCYEIGNGLSLEIGNMAFFEIG